MKRGRAAQPAPALRLVREAAPRRRDRQVPAVERSIAILRLLGKSPAPLGVNAIARELGLIPSTCLHILRVLVTQELAAFDPETKRYSLDAGILSIARGLLRRNSFSDLVQPDLDRLSKRYGVTMDAVRVIGLDHVVVVAISHADEPFHIHVDVGSRFPALISATGRCIAAFGEHDWEDIERRFEALRWDRPPSFRAWRAEVEATRANGYAVDADTYISGVTIIAAPVIVQGRVAYAVIAVGLTEQLRRSSVAKLGKELVAVAANLSNRLGSD